MHATIILNHNGIIYSKSVRYKANTINNICSTSSLFRYDTIAKPLDPDRENRILKNLQKTIDHKKHKQQDETKISKTLPPNDEPGLSVSVPIQVEELLAVEDPVNAEQFKENNSEADEGPNLSNEKDVSDFMVLGKDKFQRIQHIHMVLPPWLTSPTIISNDLKADSSRKRIDDITYISDQLKENLKSIQIMELFPVQQTVIPWILDVQDKPHPFRPRDVCVSAPTGSGKTLAYALPIVQLLQKRTQRKVRALIVLPVNELAVQVLKVFRKLCEKTSLTCALLSKFVTFETEQLQLVEEYEGIWSSKVDIVIATTGRLVEHLHSTPGFSLNSLQFLVMDEADRIMEQIHNNWLYHLDAHVKKLSDSVLSGRVASLCYSELNSESNRQPQKLLFSATLSQDPEKLQSLQLFQPKLFTAIVSRFESVSNNEQEPFEQRGDFVGKYTTPAELTEKICMTQAELKPLTLFTLISENHWKRFLCFTNTGESAHRLSFILQQLLGEKMRIEELSSGLSPNLRNSVLTKFQMGLINGLVCSDALARGIDVADVDVVISYDMPRHVKTYIHRVGRTARAGKQGLAVTMLLKHEVGNFEVSCLMLFFCFIIL